MGVYYDGTTIGIKSTTGTGGGAMGTVTQGGPVYTSPGWGGAPIADQAAAQAQAQYQQQLINYQNQLAQAAAAQKQAALRTAYEKNNQSLNSQNSTIDNAYTSAKNSINATKQAQLPQYQQQRDAASADAAQTARKVRELMAATGRYNSGTNRSQQLAVDLNRSNAISGANAAENNFNTQIGNQLSDVENQKASALSDIASKLSLLQQQYNNGSLDINSQLASEQAANAAKAMLDAQTWADQQKQLGIDNSFRQGQFDYQKTLDSWNQAFQNKQYDAQQQAQLWQQQFQQQGFTADEAYRMAQLKLQQDTLAADTAYKNAALAKSGSGGRSGGSRSSSSSSSTKPNTTTISEAKYMIEALNSGQNMPYIMSQMEQRAAADPRINTDYLKTLAGNMPIDNWQYLPGY